MNQVEKAILQWIKEHLKDGMVVSSYANSHVISFKTERLKQKHFDVASVRFFHDWMSVFEYHPVIDCDRGVYSIKYCDPKLFDVLREFFTEISVFNPVDPNETAGQKG